MYKFLLCLVLVLGIFGCPLDNCDRITDPDPNGGGPPPPDPDPDPEPLPGNPRGEHSFLFDVVEATAFGLRDTFDVDLGIKTLAAFEQQFPTRFMRHLQNKGSNTIRMATQFEGWCDAKNRFYLPCDQHPPTTPEWEVQLVGTLEIAARLGMQVELIPTFTYKDETSESFLLSHVRRVVRIVEKKGFRNIVWSAFNELWHPNSSTVAKSALTKILKILPHPRGLDFPDNRIPGDGWEGRVPPSVRLDLVDWIGFHGPRNPGPSMKAYRRTVEKYSSHPVWINETVSYVEGMEIGHPNTHLGQKPWLFTGAVFCDPKSSKFSNSKCEDISTHRDQVREVKFNVQHSGAAGYCFHMLWGFCYEGSMSNLGWAPR
jgi:hypothetical protein